MKLSDIFEDALILNEIYDTKAPVKAWVKDRLGNLEGEFSIGDKTFLIALEPFVYEFEQKKYKCINVSFSLMINGKESQQLTLTNRQSSKVLGAFLNNIRDKIPEFDCDAITFMAEDNVDQRMRIYNYFARHFGQGFTERIENIENGLGKKTVLFNNNIVNHKDFIEFLKKKRKLRAE